MKFVNLRLNYSQATGNVFIVLKLRLQTLGRLHTIYDRAKVYLNSNSKLLLHSMCDFLLETISFFSPSIISSKPTFSCLLLWDLHFIFNYLVLTCFEPLNKLVCIRYLVSYYINRLFFVLFVCTFDFQRVHQRLNINFLSFNIKIWLFLIYKIRSDRVKEV